MALHLLSAARLAADLADENVPPRDQAIYIVASFFTWAIPLFFHVAPGQAGTDAWSKGIWYAEFFGLSLVSIAGVFYCLRQCRIEPRRHFLVDFCCLMTPVAIVVAAVTWLGFYAVLGFTHVWWPNAWSLERFYTYHDALVAAVLICQQAWVYRRLGKYMARAAEMRANAVQPPVAAAVTLG